MWAYFAKELLVVVGQLTPCAKLQVFTNSWRVHEALDARCALDVERRSGAFVERILPTWFHLEPSLWPSGTQKSSRWRPEHQEDADVKENHKRCNLSQQQQHCSAEKKWCFHHGCHKTRDSNCLLMDPEVCAGSHHGHRRTTYEGVRYAIVNATSLEERFRSSSWVTAVMKTGQIRDREKLGRCHGRSPQLSPRVTVQSGRVAWKNRLGRHRKFERFYLRRRTGRDLHILEE